jgi:hypothetical protein
VWLGDDSLLAYIDDVLTYLELELDSLRILFVIEVHLHRAVHVRSYAHTFMFIAELSYI